MKKTFLVLIPVLLFTSVLFGSTGTAIISPSVVGAGSTGMTFTISYSPSTYWGTSGFLYVQIPPVGGWTSPTVGNSAPGNVTVVVASTTGGGTTFIPTSNVTISGNMITISASGFDISQYDTVEIIYGSGGGNEGVTVPISTGSYTFNISEAPTGGTLTALANSPVVTVVTLNMGKTASESNIEMGDTYTYTINYSNNSQTTANGVYIWDTIPPELTYINASGGPTVTSTGSGTFLSWYLASVSGNNTGGSITITTLVSSEAFNEAFSITNTAFATSSDIQAAGVTLQSNACIADVKGLTITERIDAYSGVVGQTFTVEMIVDNAGPTLNSLSATDVSPSAMAISLNPSLVYYQSGPSPVSVSSIAPGNSFVFTWIYLAEAAGTVVFTGSAAAEEIVTNGTAMIYSNPYSFTFVINNPSPTFTVTSTRTPTSTLTLTATPSFTFTVTGTFTATVTPTYTPTNSSTCTPSSTPTYTNTVNPSGQGSATATATSMPITVSPVVTNTPTPNLNMTLSKNYVNPDKGEKLLINVKTEANVQVKIKVYNLTGEVVRNNLDLTASAKGWNQVEWDVKNGDGKVVGEGLYFVYIEAGTDKKLLKVYIIK